MNLYVFECFGNTSRVSVKSSQLWQTNAISFFISFLKNSLAWLYASSVAYLVIGVSLLGMWTPITVSPFVILLPFFSKSSPL